MNVDHPKLGMVASEDANRSSVCLQVFMVRQRTPKESSWNHPWQLTTERYGPWKEAQTRINFHHPQWFETLKPVLATGRAKLFLDSLWRALSSSMA